MHCVRNIKQQTAFLFITLYIFRLHILIRISTRHTDERQDRSFRVLFKTVAGKMAFASASGNKRKTKPDKRFLRFGQATAGKMADVITAISTFRTNGSDGKRSGNKRFRHQNEHKVFICRTFRRKVSLPQAISLNENCAGSCFLRFI